MTSLIKSSLKEGLKAGEECERKGGKTFWNAAIIPFIPEEADEELRKTGFVELTLQVNRAGTGTKNVVKKKYKIFGHGSIEDLFEWRRGVFDIIERKPCSSPHAKFNMVEMLLTGDPAATWRDARLLQVESLDDLGDPRGESNDTFTATMRAFFKHHFPRGVNAARRQKQYLRTMLRKPKSVKIGEFCRRLKTINRYLPEFPCANADAMSRETIL